MPQYEEDIVRLLTERFDTITVEVKRERRLWLESPREGFLDVLTFLSEELGFSFLSTITGLDLGDKFQLIYHIAHKDGLLMSAKVTVPHENPVFDTATEIFKGGMLYELETRNLLGLTILGLPDDIRYPLPDGWPEGQYPLRKDWVKASPADTSADTSADSPADTSADTSADSPAGSPTDSPADTPAGSPAASPAGEAAANPANANGGSSSDAATGKTTEAKAEASGQKGGN